MGRCPQPASDPAPYHVPHGTPGRRHRRLRRMLEEAGLTQRALAERLDRNQNWVHLCEAGQRRVDVGEWIDWCGGCGRDPVEAFAELVRHRETGLLFEPGSPTSLSRAVVKMVRQTDLPTMRARVRLEFEEQFTAEQNYRQLMEICDRTLGHGSCVAELESACGIPQ